MSKPILLKPYNIVIDDENNSAVINMYGEVVDTRPIDFWTGKPVSGNFIMLDEFLSDLDALAGKENITVHINSVGGSMYAGIAIYNRLKGLAAKVTTINDGLAASAGSLIFMAGDTRKVNAGSNLMIHGAASFLYGYYQVQDLRSAIKQLEAHNKAGINIYAERTGRPAEEIKPMVDRETWMTGQDAVDQGFADEVITGDGTEGVSMKLTPDKSRLMVNGMAVAACFLGKIPDSIPVMTEQEFAEKYTPTSGGEPLDTSMPPAPRADINTHTNGGNEHMEVRNVEELRNAFPELVAQVETAARSEGVKAERDRIQGIEDIQNAVGDAQMVTDAKYGENPMNAEQLAFAAMKKNAANGAQMLGQMARDAQNSGAAAVTATPAPVEDPKGKTDDDKALDLLVSAIPANMKKEGK